MTSRVLALPLLLLLLLARAAPGEAQRLRPQLQAWLDAAEAESR